MCLYVTYTMEENERTTSTEDQEVTDFSNELVNFPHVVKYIKNLQEQLKLQQENVLDLENKLREYERPHKIPKMNLNDNETQTVWCESEDDVISEKWIVNSEKNFKSIVDQVTEVAESAIQQTGFVYEKTTGLYYHYDSGYYYDPKSGLYYDGNTGTYFYYDKDSGDYKFHSQIEKKLNKTENMLLDEKSKKSRNKDKDGMSDVEEGECVDSEDGEDSLDSADNCSIPSPDDERNTAKTEDLATFYPPCMRVIVKETNLSNVKVGSLFIVTYTGGTIGREGDHAIIIPDINISKHHAKVQYDEDKKIYEIIDLGSRNGTVLNSKRLSVAKQESNPAEIVHGSILQLGCTKLLCHIHNGHETCGHCEPGLIQSESVTEENIISLKNKHHSELKRLKSKFGLKQNNTEAASRVALGYQDRAQSRRDKVGSSSQYVKTQQSSLHESIPKNNMGFKMLSKMGWSEGKSLGKSGSGVTEPVHLLQNVNRSGLGGSEESHNVQVDSSVEKKQAIWKKTQERFNNISE